MHDAQADGYDGLSGDVIFCAWTGHNPLSSQRAESLLSIYRETCCPVLLLTPANLGEWQLADSPFHPAFRFLSETHKADYLRCYFMHHFGGGYTDLKATRHSWKALFAKLRASPHAIGLGYPESSPHDVAPVGEPLESELRKNYQKLIGNCAYIFRRNTDFTTQWIARTHRLLDAKLEALTQHPAQHPLDQRGVILPDGSLSLYPIKWTEMLGDIFHPLVYEYSGVILHADIAPSFVNYR
jgi:hypothetical protein